MEEVEGTAVEVVETAEESGSVILNGQYLPQLSCESCASFPSTSTAAVGVDGNARLAVVPATAADDDDRNISSRSINPWRLPTLLLLAGGPPTRPFPFPLVGDPGPASTTPALALRVIVPSSSLGSFPCVLAAAVYSACSPLTKPLAAPAGRFAIDSANLGGERPPWCVATCARLGLAREEGDSAEKGEEEGSIVAIRRVGVTDD